MNRIAWSDCKATAGYLPSYFEDAQGVVLREEFDSDAVPAADLVGWFLSRLLQGVCAGSLGLSEPS